MNLRLYLFVSGTDQENEGERRVQDFIAHRRAGVIECMWSVLDDQPDGGWFLFYYVVDDSLGDGCGI